MGEIRLRIEVPHGELRREFGMLRGMKRGQFIQRLAYHYDAVNDAHGGVRVHDGLCEKRMSALRRRLSDCPV